MRKSKKDIELLKEEIIKKAIVIFSEKGYSATNLQDVADALNITRTPIYYHFKDKLNLFITAVQVYCDSKDAKFIEIFKQDTDIFTKIRGDLVLCTELGRTEVTLFAELNCNPELAPAYERRLQTFQRIYNLKIENVKEAIRRKEIKQDTDVIEFVEYLYIIHFGFITIMQSQYHPFHVGLVDRLIDTFVEGLQAKYSG